jgi:starch synthase (maltosyl-transferring)
VVIERVRPQIDCGRFPIKRVIGETVTVEADVFADGHDELSCRILYRAEGEREWKSTPMVAAGNDGWRGEFSVSTLSPYRYTVEGWIDHFRTWRGDLKKRITANQDVSVELQIGAELVEQAALRASGEDARILSDWARMLRQEAATAFRDELARLMERFPDLRFASHFERDLTVVVDREKARFSTWYELFPRSASPEAGRHGTFRDVETWLPRIAGMGFDVLYLPPVHPIGHTFRKGNNNSPAAQPDDFGNPFILGWERWKIFGGWSQGLKTMGSRLLWILRSSARPIIPMYGSTRNGSESVRTVRSSTRRILQRNIKTSIRSISRVPNGVSYGRNSRASSFFGSIKVFVSFASTIHTQKLLRFGSG